MSDFVRKKIKPKRFGEILKASRQKKNVTFEQIEEVTKIRTRFLKALEEEKFEALPGNVYALGFLEKYLDYLELPKKELIQEFKLERNESQHRGHFMIRKLKESRFLLTPKILTITIVVLVTLGILTYIGISVRALALPPNLDISSPVNSQIYTTGETTIQGKTDPGATVNINDQAVLSDDRGNFSEVVKLTPGLNVFEIQATNRLKKVTTKEVKILANY